MPAEASNAETIAQWNGPHAERFLLHRDRISRINDAHSEVAFERMPVGSDERVLDIGCGFGGTTLLIAVSARPDDGCGLPTASIRNSAGASKRPSRTLSRPTKGQTASRSAPHPGISSPERSRGAAATEAGRRVNGCLSDLRRSAPESGWRVDW